MGADFVKVEEYCEVDGFGCWSLSQVQSQLEPECEEREEQACALSWSCRCSCSALLVDWRFPVSFGFLDLQGWRFVVLE